MSDEMELIAGTDPEDAASVLRVAVAEYTAGAVSLSFASMAGRAYQLESSPDLSGDSWKRVGDPVAGTGQSIMLIDRPFRLFWRLFYRVAVRATD